MIPKIIHYVWCGSPLPEDYREYVNSWRKFNPDYQFILWNEDNIDFTQPLVAEFYRKKLYQKVSDMVRLKAVLQSGGIYLDTDFLMLQSLDRLLDYHCFFGFQHEAHPTDWIANGAFGAEPQHWFVHKMLDRILRSRNSLMGIDIPTAIGPKLVTAMLRAEGLANYSAQGVFVKDIFLCPVHWFYPFGMNEVFTPECVREDTLAAHFWEKSWDQYTSRSTRLLRSLRSIARRSGVRSLR